jgi:hypothetical protein
VLELDGEDRRPRPLEERKARLQKLLAEPPVGIPHSEHLDGDGAATFAHACNRREECSLPPAFDRNCPSKVRHRTRGNELA